MVMWIYLLTGAVGGLIEEGLRFLGAAQDDRERAVRTGTLGMGLLISLVVGAGAALATWWNLEQGGVAPSDLTVAAAGISALTAGFTAPAALKRVLGGQKTQEASSPSSPAGKKPNFRNDVGDAGSPSMTVPSERGPNILWWFRQQVRSAQPNKTVPDGLFSFLPTLLRMWRPSDCRHPRNGKTPSQTIRRRS